MNPFDRFDPFESELTRDNAIALAALSELVYSDREAVTSKGLAWGFHVDFHAIDETECALFTRFDMSYAVLAFRGTSSLEDAITDADFLLEAGPLAGKVHSGFRAALSKVWSEEGSLRKVLSGFELAFKRPLNLFLTGHSLGAALATVAAAALAELGLNDSIRALYTFGSPRVGNSRFAWAITKALRGRFWRFDHNNDVVTRIPRRSFIDILAIGFILQVRVA